MTTSSIPAQREMPRVLVVDDNPTNVATVVSFLEDRGFEATIARDGEAALERVPVLRPNVVLLDALMPGLDGFETCRRLTRLDAMRDVPVIFMTALVSMDEKLRAFEVGAVDYVVKPVQREELLVRMETHLALQARTAELRELHRQEGERVARLEDLNRAKDRFFSIVAHDLRGPLSPLFGCTALLRRCVERLGDQELARIVALTDQGVLAIADLLENLLKWAELQRRAPAARYQLVALEELTTEVIRLAEPQAHAKGIEVINRVGELVLETDPGMFSTVLRNVLSNAVKFSEEGSQIQVDAGVGGQRVILTVADQGVGMSQEVIESLRLARITTSTPGTADESGAGLGMRIAMELMQALGGTLSFDSELGRGTEVTLTLPSRAPDGVRVRGPEATPSEYP